MREGDATIVDGNAIAGMLSDVLHGDATMLRGSCAECGAAEMLADAVVEIDDVAAIVRCRSCTHTLMTVIRDGDRVEIVFGMLRSLSRADSAG